MLPSSSALGAFPLVQEHSNLLVITIMLWVAHCLGHCGLGGNPDLFFVRHTHRQAMVSSSLQSHSCRIPHIPRCKIQDMKCKRTTYQSGTLFWRNPTRDNRLHIIIFAVVAPLRRRAANRNAPRSINYIYVGNCVTPIHVFRGQSKRPQ